MAQAAFEFSPSAPFIEPQAARAAAAAAAPADMAAAQDVIGFEIGRDHAHYRLTPPLRHLHGHNPVRQGWERGRQLFGRRTLRPSAAVRQWLALRLEAWQHGQAFEGVLVTPHFLARIDAATCPVSRSFMTLGTGAAGDATVARLNPAAAYAAGNLAVLSQQVVQAAAGRDAAALLALAQRVEAGEQAAPAGLDAAACMRLAVLASFATPLPHAQALLLPLRVLPPNRVRLINPVQALQLMLTLQFTQAAYARRLLGLAALMPNGETRQAFQIFMHTLLARRLAVGPAPAPEVMRQALEDSWADALVNRRWQRLASRLNAADCELLLQRASQRGLVVGGGRWLSGEAAVEGWALPQEAVPAAAPRPLAAGSAEQAPSQPGTDSLIFRPGSARSLGSQKLAS